MKTESQRLEGNAKDSGLKIIKIIEYDGSILVSKLFLPLLRKSADR